MTTRLMVRNLSVDADGSSCSFELKTSYQGVANALRRAIACKCPSVAASTATFRQNTSCQTDEYIAHRIAMIPFVIKDGTVPLENVIARVSVSNRQVMSGDLICDAVRPVRDDIPIMKLGTDQKFEVDVRFSIGTDADHVRHSHVTDVCYKELDSDRRHNMGFRMIDGTSSLTHLVSAIESLEKNLDELRYIVEKETVS